MAFQEVARTKEENRPQMIEKSRLYVLFGVDKHNATKHTRPPIHSYRALFCHANIVNLHRYKPFSRCKLRFNHVNSPLSFSTH